ncbi:MULTISPECIES: ubiquitin-conjugating enzyme E2 [Halorubrum]|uniref:ubiquitin-conjugating enzyme E2 n=1 Tax=Halorubrum TaxID=56688 RepID=UPI0011329E1E|nr:MULTISPECIES: ubiquitin-conjugating enzyme E2 [Halorubrum]
MTLARTLNDVRELKQELQEEFSGRLQYDLSESREIRIDGFAFPDGWQHRSGGRHGPLLIEIPEKYPEHPPRVYIADDMRYNGSRPQCMAPARVDSTAEWAPLSLLGNQRAWNPNSDSLVTLFDQLERVLSNPIGIEDQKGNTGDSND